MIHSKSKFALVHLVEVHWQDASTRSCWGAFEEYLEHAPVNCVSVGYLLKRDKEHILLAQTQSDDHQCNSAIAIPSKWLKSIRVIATTKPKRKQAKKTSK